MRPWSLTLTDHLWIGQWHCINSSALLLVAVTACQEGASESFRSARVSVPDPPQQDIHDAVTATFAALLEMSLWPPFRPRQIGISDQLEGRHLGQRLEHPFGIGHPVGGQMYKPVGAKPIGHKLQKRRLDQAALVVALLWPGVGKIDSDLLEAGHRNLLLEHLDRIPDRDPDVVQTGRLDGAKQAPDTGLMDFDPEEIEVRFIDGHEGQGLAVAATDLDDQRPVAIEQAGRILAVVRQLIARQQLLKRPSLSRRKTTRSTHEASNTPVPVVRVLRTHDCCSSFSHSKMAVLAWTPIRTCSRISDWRPSATRDSISMPRLIGPG